ncbi:MAG TPA: hypothetical protein VMT87_11655 [Vicinamibacteria bacterium]|nr:hypothetical protein [Vicinamibacteria bacterium]
MGARSYRAGERTPDLCRACKLTREHTVMAVDGEGRVLRVVCGFCGSEHNYRGGDAADDARPARPARPAAEVRPTPATLPLVSERERTAPRMSTTDQADDLELLLRRVLREELGLTVAAPAEKWRGGELVLRPGKPGLQEKTWPIESFFNKIVMIRNRLRTLEQQVNASELPEDAKLRLQSYITGCYGSLTSFNVLFADEQDYFRGSGGAE